ncbi:hypothetical protein ACSBR1_043934 (mitochondrion) [Camellia fascicularis]
MPTLNQLIRHGREEKRRTDRTRASDQCPQKQGVRPRVSTRTPKKPNSALRKIAKVRLSNRHDIFAHIPGEGHNSQEHSMVLIRGGRVKDSPGVKSHCIRGVKDLLGIPDRRRGRSKYDSSSLSSSNSSHFNPTANWNDSLSEPTTTTINDYSFQSSGTQGSSHGLFEDHPGLHPSSERIIELQSDIHEKLGELMINRSPEDVMVAAEALHAESENLPFLESLLKNLTINGVQGEAYTDALDLAGGN